MDSSTAGPRIGSLFSGYGGLDYVREEYPEPDPDADEDDQVAMPTKLAWVHGPGRWKLHDDGHDTAVRVCISAVYGPPVAPSGSCVPPRHSTSTESPCECEDQR